MNVGIFVAREYPGPHQMYFTLENAEPSRDWQAICQMFILCLLTRRGSVPTDPQYGTTFVQQLWAGLIRTDAQLKAAFDFAVMDVLQYLARRGYAQRRPDAGRLGRATLRKWAIIEGHAEIWVDFHDAAGNKITTYWVPVNQPVEMEAPA
jgi:hypothetical protein